MVCLVVGEVRKGRARGFWDEDVSMAVSHKHVGDDVYLVISDFRLPIELVFVSGTFP